MRHQATAILICVIAVFFINAIQAIPVRTPEDLHEQTQIALSVINDRNRELEQQMAQLNLGKVAYRDSGRRHVNGGASRTSTQQPRLRDIDLNDPPPRHENSQLGASGIEGTFVNNSARRQRYEDTGASNSNGYSSELHSTTNDHGVLISYYTTGRSNIDTDDRHILNSQSDSSAGHEYRRHRRMLSDSIADGGRFRHSRLFQMSHEIREADRIHYRQLYNAHPEMRQERETSPLPIRGESNSRSPSSSVSSTYNEIDGSLETQVEANVEGSSGRERSSGRRRLNTLFRLRRMFPPRRQ